MYSVRPATVDDLSAVLVVLGENAASAPEQPTAPSEMTERRVAMWKRIMATPDVTVYLAESGVGEPAGTACLSVLPNVTYDCRPTAFIEAVAVRYQHRRRGVARLMMERILDDARAAGCFKVQLLSHKRHADDGAHALYRSIGFQAEAEGFRRYLD
ncbi:MAG: GNAT family N-acetyltransferase [Mycobacterium sp.]|nr:GNAT family N-acetyltransferase [Mycobacterium sp.]